MDKGQILIYQADDLSIKVDVQVKNETVWLSQKQIAQVFDVATNTINGHLKNIYQSQELMEDQTIRDYRIVGLEGNKTVERLTKFYNLDAILSVGYRVNSRQAAQFRRWATETLKDYIVKGFVLNDERFKSGNSMNYFDELQGRIREIRLSEKFFYQKIKDIYATSIDYNPQDKKTVQFFKVVQNKLLWAISQQTAAELIYRRVDADLPLLGMTCADKVNKQSASIAKNYLNEDEMKLLGLLVEQYLAFAENMALQQMPMKMVDWIERLDAIVKINGRELLTHAGKITHKLALIKSEKELEKYKIKQNKIIKNASFNQLEQDIKALKK